MNLRGSANQHEVRVLIAGGGTGGHVFPAIAIAQAIQESYPSAQIQFVGTKAGVENRVVPHAGFALRTIWISGFARRRILKNLALPLKLIVSFGQCYRLLRAVRPQIVIGSGGYVMGPVLLVAQKLGYPTLIQEQNSLPGVTTRKLAAGAGAICVGFDDSRQRLGSAKAVFTGNPVRSEFRVMDRASSLARWKLDPSRKTLLVFGGSLGARSVNEALATVLPQMIATYNVIWQTGRSGVPVSVSREFIHEARTAGRLAVLDFIEDMATAYAAADLSVCRAGAMTLAELALAGLPAILVPYPHAADDHQTVNAQSVVAVGAATWIADRELEGPRVLHAVSELLGDAARLSGMAAAMRSLGKPDAARRIAAIAMELASKS
ncbi:undecaprenyldiphospho-muramoylpentapeptide beta-N-acetylglucosaminyltransferase [candidate division KSB1 bacterium]|nr:undecaprenyldiphospho-muramoylpentapeptide beta-N-acetylglucosaminyltransferase [candidate division KSB1 bacterium]